MLAKINDKWVGDIPYVYLDQKTLEAVISKYTNEKVP